MNTEKINELREYFKEDLEAIDIELEKSKRYSDIIDEEINKLNHPSLGPNKGGQHYLIEHIQNAVQLQTQRQGLRKDKFNIKKIIMDYSLKDTDSETTSASELMAKMDAILAADKKQASEKPVDDIDLDSIIDEKLEDNTK